MASPFNTEAAFAQSGGGAQQTRRRLERIKRAGVGAEWGGASGGAVRQYDLDEVGRVTSFKGEFEQSKKCTFAMKGNVKSRWR
jgi:hypothetical protein